MPIVAHSSLPSLDDLRRADHDVLSRDGALHEDIRELHIGLLYRIPDAALRVTERQFLRMVRNFNKSVQMFVRRFTVCGVERSAEARPCIPEKALRVQSRSAETVEKSQRTIPTNSASRARTQ